MTRQVASRLVVFVDSVYRESHGVVYGEIAFTTFVSALARDGIAVTQVAASTTGPVQLTIRLGRTQALWGFPTTGR